MTSATCPACGVTVLPGYARCPKCRAPLPYGSGSRVGMTAGGTALDERKLPVLPLVAVGLVIAAGIAYFALRTHARPAPTLTPIATAAGQAITTPTPVAPTIPTNETKPIERTPSAGAVASQLEAALKKLRLWSTVEVRGDHVDVRSGACEDPQMGPSLATAQAGFHAAGLTRLRCLEQSGRVVFEHPL